MIAPRFMLETAKIFSGRLRFRAGCLAWMCALAIALAVPRASAQPDGSDRPAIFLEPEFRPSQTNEEAFLHDAAARFPSKEAGSRELSGQAWEQLRAGSEDLAVESFYRAWLLDGKNYSVYWGSGAILARRGKLLSAIRELDIARELIDDPNELSALLVDAGNASSQYAAMLPRERELERARYFVKANQCFTESLENDHDYAPGWRAWALSLYEQERYQEAAVKAARAQELHSDPLPKNVLDELRKKRPSEQ